MEKDRETDLINEVNLSMIQLSNRKNFRYLSKQTSRFHILPKFNDNDFKTSAELKISEKRTIEEKISDLDLYFASPKKILSHDLPAMGTAGGKQKSRINKT